MIGDNARSGASSRVGHATSGWGGRVRATASATAHTNTVATRVNHIRSSCVDEAGCNYGGWRESRARRFGQVSSTRLKRIDDSFAIDRFRRAEFRSRLLQVVYRVDRRDLLTERVRLGSQIVIRMLQEMTIIICIICLTTIVVLNIMRLFLVVTSC